MKKKVAVGLSGGVDSSLSAALLLEQGYDVTGFFMKNWEEAEGTCTAAQDAEDVARTCDLLKIPFYTLRFVEEYREKVFSEFLEELKKGRTPNPDILCNREIKFKLFLEKARALGADFLATGHYCRTNEAGALLKGIDPNKDQSYFLHAVSSSALQKVLFPVGGLLKSEVKKKARSLGLAAAEKKESMGICFIGKRDFKSFLIPYLGYAPGPLCTSDGKQVGVHDGAAYYTLGQRHGIGLGGEGEPWYVVGKEGNTVYVERGKDHPLLFSRSLVVEAPTWVQGPPPFPFSCHAKIRYRQKEEPCTIFPQEDGTLLAEFESPQRAATPGQAVVFYEGDICLGGGTIVKSSSKSSFPSLAEESVPSLSR